MPSRNYWLDLFTWQTWQEFFASGAQVSGFRESRWATVQRIKPGDYFLCYLTGISRFIGILEVISNPFKDESPIWKDEIFPCRLKVKVIVSLEPEVAVPIHQLRDKLTIFQDLSSPNAWTGHLRGSPAKWNKLDGETIVQAVANAKTSPVVRPIDPAKLKRRPKAIKAKIGLVTIPESEVQLISESGEASEQPIHAEVQWLLLRLGNDMGLDVWVAKNDKNKKWGNHQFSNLKRMRKSLPLQFDEATNKTIELIDVLWLTGNTILAAFEIESTTSIYSGLLRLSDLISMQPNINIPLFIVAPDDKRNKVISEINRPTFSRLSPPMNQMCRYISFSSLKKGIEQVENVVQYLKPEFLEELSESCEPEGE